MKVATLGDGDVTVDVLPDRGLDLATAAFRGTRFSWESPLGHIPWQGDFARSFGGGLLVTCGLRNAGAASEGQPLHGWYSSQAARDVELGRTRAGGRVVDGEVPGPVLELTREIVVESSRIRVTDVVRNVGPVEEAAPLLYHVNLLWDSLDVDSSSVVPRDDDARAGDWRSEGPPGPERVYEHVGATHATVSIGAIRIQINTNMPRLWQWIHPSFGVLGIEPANCSVLGRGHDRAEGRLPSLAPGESRSTSLEISLEVA